MLLRVQENDVCLVAPQRPTPASTLIPLTCFDTRYLGIPYLQMVIFYPGQRSQGEVKSLIEHAKSSLSEALVHFYPLAGRLVLGFNEQKQEASWEIVCNDAGVEWTVATADSELSALDYSQPSSEFSSLIRNGRYDANAAEVVLSIQVTVFKCGGISVAWARNHALTDGNGYEHFLVSWSEFCMKGQISRIPRIDLHLDELYPQLVQKHPTKIESYATRKDLGHVNPLSCRIFRFGEQEIKCLKQQAGTEFSSFVVLSAHIWRCMCAARELPDSHRTTNSVTANCRRRLEPPLPDEYFMNCVLHAVAETTVRDLRDGGLTYAARLVRNAIQDLNMQAIEEKLTSSGIAANSLGKNSNTLCTSSQKFRYYQLDLGWGKPNAVRQVGLDKHDLDGICTFNPGPNSPHEFEITISLAPVPLEKLAILLESACSQTIW